jgi:hypothetical protein
MPRRLLLPLCLLLLHNLRAQSGWFPFSLSWEDDSKSAADASDLLVDFPGQDPSTVVDGRGFLRAGADGHFFWERTGRRARFWGVNFTFNANFPPSPDTALRTGEFPDLRAADKIARRLAKLGVNVVRFHHMDTQGSPSGIWDTRYYPGDTQHLDPGQLRRLDWLIYQFRQNGIYVNLNLKVGRHFGPGDGVEFAELFEDPLSYFQGVSHFNGRMIELQQDYARQLLAHRNPYTGKTYAEDPVVAFVEIANEDSLFGNMLSDGGLNYRPGVPGSLPESYSRELDGLWNSWLASRYTTREALEMAWRGNERVADPSNRIRNWSFENGMSDWSVNQIGAARAYSTIEAGSGPDGGSAIRIAITADGTTWHTQLYQNGLGIEKDKTYEFSFYGKASSPGGLGVDVMQGVDPWSNYGLSTTVQLTTSWQRFTTRLRANATDPGTVRPTFELGSANNTIWIDQVEFRQVVPQGLESGESFEAGSVRRPMRSELGSYTPQRISDLFRFYSRIDEDYFTGMLRFLKEQLGVHALVAGTAPWWAYLGDTAVQARMDYVDGHYYWDHPSWPAGRAWQATGWRITNRPWINQLQDFSGVAAQAVEGKPFTVSEFNEVFPNRYALEGPLLAALVANLQDWDAVYLFDYAGNASSYAASYTASFFSHSGNPIKSAQLPICSRIFLGRQTTAAPTSIRIELNRDELAAGFAKGLVNAASFLEEKGLDRRTFLKEKVRIRSFDLPAPAPVDRTMDPGGVLSSNGELLWNRDDTSASFMLIRGPAVQGAIGFVTGRTLEMGDWSFVASGPPSNHMAVLLQSRDGEALRETRHMILSVWTEHQNTGMSWNADQTSVDNRWGSAPTVVCPVRVDLTLRFPAARALRLFPLDETGSRRGELPAAVSDGERRFQIDTGQDRTIWYEIEINDPADSLSFSAAAPGLSSLYTDASPADWQAGWMEVKNYSGPALQQLALLEYSTRGILTSVVRMPAASPAASARIPLIHDARVDTALALLNTESTANRITMQVWDSSGAPRGEPLPLDPLSRGESTAFFIGERFSLGSSFEGTVELKAPMPFYALVLRSITNASGDFCLTPYPADSASSGSLYFAHLVADHSYSSDILLWNSRREAVTVRLEFFSSGGQPAALADQPASVQVTLAPGQLRHVSLARTNSAFSGYARLSAVSGPALPSSTAVITRYENGSPTSEVGIPATPARADELIVLAERPDTHEGLALLNSGAAPARVDLDLLGMESAVPAQASATLTLQTGERRAFFLYEIFSGLPSYATGLIRIHSSSEFAALALLGVTNQRGDFLMASVTGEPGQVPLIAGGTAVLPRFVNGGGYRTILYLLPERMGTQASEGVIRFNSTAGVPFPLVFR